MTHLSVPEKFLRVKFVIGKVDTSGGVCVDQGDIISSDRLHHHDQTIQTGGVKTLDKTTTSSTVNTGTLNLTTGTLLYTQANSSNIFTRRTGFVDLMGGEEI